MFQSPCTTSGQETERVYCYNPGARTHGAISGSVDSILLQWTAGRCGCRLLCDCPRAEKSRSGGATGVVSVLNSISIYSGETPMRVDEVRDCNCHGSAITRELGLSRPANTFRVMHATIAHHDVSHSSGSSSYFSSRRYAVVTTYD